MARKLRFEEAAEDHRESIEAVALLLEAQEPSRWAQPVMPGRWSPAEIAQHLALAYAPAIAELEGGRGYTVRLPWWQRALARAVVVPRILAGRFPRGAPAPRESRPKGGATTPGDGARALRASAALFERRLSEARASGPVRVTHPYFGRLEAATILRLLAVHAAHHRAQLPASPVSS